MSFKQQLISSVAAIAGPWNCFVDRDIRLLKAHLCCRSFSSNCMGVTAPERSSACGFVVTIICHTVCHTFVRGLIYSMRIHVPVTELTGPLYHKKILHEVHAYIIACVLALPEVHLQCL